MNRRDFISALGGVAAISALPTLAASVAVTRYVRPRREEGYGAGDGRSYEDAWNGFGAMTESQWHELDAADVSSTLWVCGTHFERIDLVAYSGEFGGARFTAAGRQDGLVIRGDHFRDPGTIDTRPNQYYFKNRSLGPHRVYDQWITGVDADAGTNCASVDFCGACNVTISKLTIYAGASPLNCTPGTNPTAKRMDLYYPPGGLVVCKEAPYSGRAIRYPQNVAIFSNSNSRNLRVSGCTIIGNGKNNRSCIGLQGGAGEKLSIITIDGNDISGFLKGVMMSFGHNSRVSVSVRANKVHDLGFSDGDHDFVDGINCYGDFNNRSQTCEIVGNDISGFYQDGIDLFGGGGVLVKDNYIHDAKLTHIKYMTEPHWNADERKGDQNGIKFGGDGSFSGNRLIGNRIENILLTGITSNDTGNRSMIVGNLLVNTGSLFGGDGIAIFGTQAIQNVVANNTVVGYKRAISCTSAENVFINNICMSMPKDKTYINSALPQADILFSGNTAHDIRTYTNLLANNLLIKQAGAISDDLANKSGDPMFVNEARKNFHLKRNSPCLGRGTFPGFKVVDNDGIIMHPPYSIGAYYK